MKAKIYLVVFVVLLSFTMIDPKGEIRGTIREKNTNNTIPFASVTAFLKDSQVVSTLSDIDGKFSLKPIPPGKYSVKATSIGYSPEIISNVEVTEDKVSFVDISLAKGIELK